MTRWWTADQHFGHANIIGYAGRPFQSVEAMNAELISNWNDTVSPDDEVMILGDFALGRIVDTLPLVRLLVGRKTLVTGNHDRCWAGHRKGIDQWSGEYLTAGFDVVIHGPREVDLNGLPVLVDHFPYRGDSHGAERYVDYRPVDLGQWLVHGHVHERWRQSDRQINVGVDAWAGRPISDDELAVLIETGPRDLAPLVWPGEHRQI